MNLDLFQSTLVEDRLKYFGKHKRIEWLYTADFCVVTSEEQLRVLVEEFLASKSEIAIDTETSGLDIGSSRIVGISCAIQKEDKAYKSFYVPLYSQVEKIEIPFEKSLSILKPLIEKPAVYRNGKFDYQVLKKCGIKANILADISVDELFIKDMDDREFSKLKNSSLKERCSELLGKDMLELSDIAGKEKVFDFSLFDQKYGKWYAAADSTVTLELRNLFKPKIDPKNFIYRLETMILPIVAEMEYAGVAIDQELLKDVKQKLIDESKECENKIFELSGEKFNVGSSQQLGKVIYEKMGLECSVYTPGGEKSVGAEAIEALEDKHPIIKEILKYKENEKLLSTFISNLSGDSLGSDGRARTSFRPYGAISGRFTASGIPIHQIPKAEDGGKSYIRKAFVPAKGYYFLDVDYSQIELRILCSFCGDENMRDAFEKGIDLHTRTANVMFGTPIDKVTSDERKRAKTLNFGMVYGMSPFSLSKDLGCSLEEAEKLYNAYFDKFPRIKQWIKTTKNKIKQEGFAQTHWGRKRLLPDAKLTVDYNDKSPEGRRLKALLGAALREGCNHRIQGTSASIIKIALVRLAKKIKEKNLDIKTLLQVHDELVFEVNENIPLSESVPLIVGEMEVPVENFVKLQADAAVGYSWGSCIDYEPGMTLDQVPYKEKITISGDVVGCGDKLKELFGKFKGNNEVFLEVGGSLIQPDNTDTETGEITPITVCASKALIKNIEDLGLKVK